MLDRPLHRAPPLYAALWLVYLAFVFLEPYLGRQSATYWVLAVASIGVFLPLYFGAFAQPPGSRRTLLSLGLMAALGLVLVPINIGASTFVIFAASLAGHTLPRRQAYICVAVLLGALLAVTLLTRRPFAWWMLTQPLILLTVGVGNVLMAEERRRTMQLRRAQEEVEAMATLAERERIARDLHDLLGHTLSVIALKSELASKLADTQPAQAAREIRDVERTARQALREVRHAVEGYRSRGLSGELQQAKSALAAAGVAFEASVTAGTLSAKHEAALALVLREAVTNVVRHARASTCRVRLERQREHVVLSVQDDGVGGVLQEGSGLTGMRERVAALGGDVQMNGDRGACVTVRVPAVAAPAIDR